MFCYSITSLFSGEWKGVFWSDSGMRQFANVGEVTFSHRDKTCNFLSSFIPSLQDHPHDRRTPPSRPSRQMLSPA